MIGQFPSILRSHWSIFVFDHTWFQDYLELGYNVHVVVDCSSSRNNVDRMFAFQRMKVGKILSQFFDTRLANWCLIVSVCFCNWLLLLIIIIKLKIDFCCSKWDVGWPQQSLSFCRLLEIQECRSLNLCKSSYMTRVWMQARSPKIGDEVVH